MKQAVLIFLVLSLVILPKDLVASEPSISLLISAATYEKLPEREQKNISVKLEKVIMNLKRP